MLARERPDDARAGFLAAYHEDHDEDETDVESEDEKSLPALEPGERVALEQLRPEQHFTQPPPRYTEASLVKSLESHGIGRPSTYASIIETLRYRRYVEMIGRAFIPTDIGKIVSKFLVKYLGHYVDYGFTALMEDVLDAISNGEKKWQHRARRVLEAVHQAGPAHHEVRQPRGSRGVARSRPRPGLRQADHRAHGGLRAIRAAGHPRRRGEAALREPAAGPAHGRRHAAPMR